MGCTSSTEVVTDPVTGQIKTKKKLGGAYPGQRRPQNQPYIPSASEFGKDGQAVTHFVAYGGGNALTLVKKDGSYQPEAGKQESEYIQVTLPAGVEAGQTIHVQAPDGRLNAIVIPPGFGPGSTFTVEFASDEPAHVPSTKTSTPTPSVYATPTAQVQAASTSSAAVDDGFAAGFNNPNYVPPTATATAVSYNEPEVNVNPYYNHETDPDSSSYPTTSATPVYSSTPQYPSK